MVYFTVKNKPDNGQKFETIYLPNAEAEKKQRERSGIACIIERKVAR